MRPIAWVATSLVTFLVTGAATLVVSATVSSATGVATLEREYVLLGHSLLWGASAVPIVLAIGRGLSLRGRGLLKRERLQAVAGVAVSSVLAASGIWSSRNGGILDVDRLGLSVWLPAATLSVVVSSSAHMSAARPARSLWAIIVAWTAASAVTLTVLALREGSLASPVHLWAATTALVYVIGASLQALRMGQPRS